jgi:hypothetical protein
VPGTLKGRGTAGAGEQRFPYPRQDGALSVSGNLALCRVRGTAHLRLNVSLCFIAYHISNCCGGSRAYVYKAL